MEGDPGFLSLCSRARQRTVVALSPGCLLGEPPRRSNSKLQPRLQPAGIKGSVDDSPGPLNSEQAPAGKAMALPLCSASVRDLTCQRACGLEGGEMLAPSTILLSRSPSPHRPSSTLSRRLGTAGGGGEEGCWQAAGDKGKVPGGT